MTTALDRACCARIPASALAVLAGLRREPGITVRRVADHAWVCWEAGSDTVLRRLLPVPGVRLYVRRDDLWYRPGAHLPAFDVPHGLDDETIPLARAVIPRPIRAIACGTEAPVPVRLGLARDATAREASALWCTLAELGRWVEMAPTSALAALEAAWAGDGVLIRGRRLPVVGGPRYWGGRLLTPLGCRPEPALAEAALRQVLGVAEDEIVVLEADGFETIPCAALGPLTRAGVRLALGGPSS